MEVKRTLTRTSMRAGGATCTSSITSGSPGPHATAAVCATSNGDYSDHSWRRRGRCIDKNRKMARTRGGGGVIKIGGEPLHLMGFPLVLPPLEYPLVAMVNLSVFFVFSIKGKWKFFPVSKAAQRCSWQRAYIERVGVDGLSAMCHPSYAPT